MGVGDISMGLLRILKCARPNRLFLVPLLGLVRILGTRAELTVLSKTGNRYRDIFKSRVSF
jgi:hypothetical protein